MANAEIARIRTEVPFAPAAAGLGPYAAPSHGVSDEKYSVAWPEITEHGLGSGTPMFNGSRRRSTAPETARVFHVPHGDRFMTLCRRPNPDLKG
ncbi:hypothetical protein ABZY16_16035 [Streptomyces sp. NPDC006553]|uniref:hypothetical protein n=1 Tax=unclassified Streptomyces TaxID=2593676 RepID=UPI002250AD72|nr:hypothetical protein [Streptomyces sp. NBC_00233]MCX5231287.1 hypothetical protein [Streptomyces sp. NBC_00233]